MNSTKKCNKCKYVKDLSFFHKSNNTLDGLHSICKECRKLHFTKNTEKYKEYKNKSLKKIRDERKLRIEKLYTEHLNICGGKHKELLSKISRNLYYGDIYSKKEKRLSRALTLISKIKNKKSCELCNIADCHLDFHHVLYEDRKNVIVLCKKCHLRLHNGILEEKLLNNYYCIIKRWLDKSN